MRTIALLAALLLTMTACKSDETAPATEIAPSTSASSSSTSLATTSGPLALVLISDAMGSDEQVLVTVRLTNQSSESVTVVVPSVTPNFVRFAVTDGTGRDIPFGGEYPRLEPLDASGFADLAPGDSTEYTFDLASSYDLEAGAFRVGAEYRNPADASHEGGAALTFEAGSGIQADPISVEVSS